MFQSSFCLIFAFISSIYIFVFILCCLSSCAANKLFLWPIVGHTNAKLRGYKAILNWGSPRATRSNNGRGKKKMASLRNNNVTQRFIECNKRKNMRFSVAEIKNLFTMLGPSWVGVLWSFAIGRHYWWGSFWKVIFFWFSNYENFQAKIFFIRFWGLIKYGRLNNWNKWQTFPSPPQLKRLRTQLKCIREGATVVEFIWDS